MSENQQRRFEPGTLWPRLVAQTEHALRCGALQPIATAYEFVEHNGIRFLVRVVSNLRRKDAATQHHRPHHAASRQDFNPFLPYEDDLFVTDISDTHLGLLNKFNVVDHHLLIVTRAFEEQESVLNQRDFAALWACMAEYNGLAFYNSGTIAGASQRHKHLQLIPLPLAPNGPPLLIEPLLASAPLHGVVGTISAFPFVHAVARLDPAWTHTPWQAADALLACYHHLLHAVGLPKDGNRVAGAYNLLATREWMLLVPRAREHCDGLSVNALGFAGALLVRNAQQLDQLKAYGPMHILRDVAFPTAGS